MDIEKAKQLRSDWQGLENERYTGKMLGVIDFLLAELSTANARAEAAELRLKGEEK